MRAEEQVGKRGLAADLVGTSAADTDFLRHSGVLRGIVR